MGSPPLSLCTEELLDPRKCVLQVHTELLFIAVTLSLFLRAMLIKREQPQLLLACFTVCITQLQMGLLRFLNRGMQVQQH